ncbi:hypothetical protein IC006_0248 [Sulfuracidifex tepidarius]|uniref:Uncharacterized protein n=1 Tax=Sulfuracidifex tepidarius TaxID=1294262 RepID=A0A510DS33_9CREN|nr:hypothetical protein IC006_0248 [Sulfuracidifex tepidarius]
MPVKINTKRNLDAQMMNSPKSLTLVLTVYSKESVIGEYSLLR